MRALKGVRLSVTTSFLRSEEAFSIPGLGLTRRLRALLAGP